jgi:hypothetical protein
MNLGGGCEPLSPPEAPAFGGAMTDLLFMSWRSFLKVISVFKRTTYWVDAVRF